MFFLFLFVVVLVLCGYIGIYRFWVLSVSLTYVWEIKVGEGGIIKRVFGGEKIDWRIFFIV